MKHAVSAGGIVIVREPSGVFVALLKDHKDRWVLPKGKIEGRETLGACAIREAREELGIGETPLTILAKLDVLQFYYRLPNDPVTQFKRVHLYLLEAPARAPLNFLAHVPSGRESFKDAAWFPFDEAERITFRQKRAFAAARRHVYPSRGKKRPAAGA